jgi:hypothetical protein
MDHQNTEADRSKILLHSFPCIWHWSHKEKAHMAVWVPPLVSLLSTIKLIIEIFPFMGNQHFWD